MRRIGSGLHIHVYLLVHLILVVHVLRSTQYCHVRPVVVLNRSKPRCLVGDVLYALHTFPVDDARISELLGVDDIGRLTRRQLPISICSCAEHLDFVVVKIKT